MKINYQKVWKNYVKSLPKNEEGGFHFNLIEYTEYIEKLIKEGLSIDNLDEVAEKYKIKQLKKGVKASSLRDEGIIYIRDLPKVIKEVLE